MPTTEHREDPVPGPVTRDAAEPVPAQELWTWLRGELPLSGDDRTVLEFGSRAWPKWEHEHEGTRRALDRMGHTTVAATRDQIEFTRRLRGEHGDDK